MASVETLSCPSCSGALSAIDVLDTASVAEPAWLVVQFLCPRCRSRAWARVEDGRIEAGLPAADAREFRATSAAAAPGLSVRADGAWLDCWLEGRYRRFPAKLASARR